MTPGSAAGTGPASASGPGSAPASGFAVAPARASAWRVVRHVVVKELLQLRRDRKIIPALVLGPIAQVLALGYAANTDVRLVPLVLVDQDRTRASRALAERFTASGWFRLAGAVDSPGAIEDWLVHDRAQMALVIGSGYEQAVERARSGEPGDPARVQAIADGSDANSAIVALGYASGIVTAAGVELAAARWVRDGRAPPRVELLPRVFYNPDLRSRWFYVPALLALVLMLTTMIVPSMAVVREREIGTLEQISVSPLRPWQLVAGKLLPFAAIGMADLVLITGLARGLFGVPLRGSFLLLAGLTLLFLTNTLGMGLFISTLVRTQQQAMMTSAFTVMVPMIYLSGLIFPIENMPPVVQQATRFIPLRYYNLAVRGIFLKGSGLDVLWPEAAAMAVFGVVFVTAAALRFRKTLD